MLRVETLEYLMLGHIFYVLVWNIVIISYFIISFLNFQCSCCALLGFSANLEFQEGEVKRRRQYLWSTIEMFLEQ